MHKDNPRCCASSLIDIHYHTKETLSRACTDIFEDILRKTYDIDEPLATLPNKCTAGIQVGTSKAEEKNKKDIDINKLIGYL